jgi:hypothetical protein
MLLLRDLVTAIGVELVRHLRILKSRGRDRYQSSGVPCNNAPHCK